MSSLGRHSFLVERISSCVSIAGVQVTSDFCATNPVRLLERTELEQSQRSTYIPSSLQQHLAVKIMAWQFGTIFCLALKFIIWQ